MINLLPDETKKQIRAARANSILIKYLFVLIAASIFLVLSYAVLYLFLQNNQPSKKTSVDTSINQTAVNAYNQTKNQYDALFTSFSNVKQIMDQQISYSDIITGLGAALPQGVVIEDLSLDNNKIGTPITIKAIAKTDSDATKIKDGFKDSQLFTNFSVQSIKSGSNNISGYLVEITISLTINKGLSR